MSAAEARSLQLNAATHQAPQCGDFADSLCIVPPVYALSPEKAMNYGMGIAQALFMG